ncbi:hypothetical protein PMG71_03985 [Roseofilum sp. BLCC_M154]|uniref:Type II toxin-antitoxin system ParD family antitoxin n=1 Tax=Roseofilum acuticapitatum BLCC-M154 TaxID=3022444 RepID=A0ABT7ANV8_9CYAN|nr:hypothetical protein [Roseofilum acuticapitatum]MDJ1168581.1 hypothetical protein [Roseofilum acuticapitatum BLCC-M154]
MMIALTEEQTQVLTLLVKQGRYASLQEALDAALMLLVDETELEELEDNPQYLQWLEHTRQKLEEGLEQSKRGDVLDGETVIAKLRQKVLSAREQEQ